MPDFPLAVTVRQTSVEGRLVVKLLVGEAPLLTLYGDDARNVLRAAKEAA